MENGIFHWGGKGVDAWKIMGYGLPETNPFSTATSGTVFPTKIRAAWKIRFFHAQAFLGPE